MMNLMIAYANSAGDRWAAWIVAASLDAAVLLAVIGLVWLAIRKRVAPQVGYCLFLLVPLKLLVPVVVTVPAALARWTPSVARLVVVRRGSRPREDREPTAGRDADRQRRDSHRPRRPRPNRGPSKPMRPAADVPSSSCGRGPCPVATGRIPDRLAGRRHAALGRLVAAQLRFRARLRQMAPLDESKLAVDLRELCRRAGVAETIRIVEDDSIAVPAVWGIVRPTIILPRGIASSLTAEQLRWVLLHELAHVRRRDLMVLVLQRFAAILHFFNPAIWIANRIIHQLPGIRLRRPGGLARRRFRRSSPARRSCGSCEHADRGRRGLEGALGIFGLDSRAACFLRVRRLLDTERPIRTAPGGWSLWGLVLLAVVSVPHLRAAGEATPEYPQAPAAEAPPGRPRNSSCASWGRTGSRSPGPRRAAGDPLPTADGSARASSSGSDCTGSSWRRTPRGGSRSSSRGLPSVSTCSSRSPATARTGRGGRPRIMTSRSRPASPPSWRRPGRSGGSSSIPTASRSRAWRSAPASNSRNDPAMTRQFGSGAGRRPTPRADGGSTACRSRWPRSTWRSTTRASCRSAGSSTRGEFGIEPGREPIEQDRAGSRPDGDRQGHRRGGETDRRGAGAHQVLERHPRGDDGAGRRLHGWSAASRGPTRLVVSAKGRATDMKELNIEPGMGPVDFRMKPGGTVRIRVLDEQGNPVPRARIFFQRWRGRFQYFEFDHVNQYADEQRSLGLARGAPGRIPGGHLPARRDEIAPTAADRPRGGVRLSRARAARRLRQGHRRGHQGADQGVPGRPGGAVRAGADVLEQETTASSPPTAITRSAGPRAIPRT